MAASGLTASGRDARGPGPTSRSCRAALLALALGALSCGRAPELGAGWPAGALVAGRASALETLLAQLSRIEGTPVAREARAFLAALPDCETVESHVPEASLSRLRTGLRCADLSGALAAVHRDRGGRDLLFAWPLGDERATASAQVSASGDLEVTLALPGGAFHGTRALLRPGAESPGPAVLGGADSLVHARLRPAGGIDLPALLEHGAQGERLFALRSRLFGAAVLDGTWELALYLPGEGERLPRAALALGVRNQEVSEDAADEFLDEIEAAWPVRRRPFGLGGARGACLPELRVLPGLAPCYVAIERALVVGWNAASVRKALDGSAPTLPAAGGLVAELARLPAADARIAAPVRPVGAPAWPWRRLVAEPLRAGASVELRIALAAGVGA